LRGSAESRLIEGTYRNATLGYSIKIPRGLKDVADDQAGPERGVRISLPSGEEIVVFGEPHTLEYKSPEEGVRAELTIKGCESDQREIKRALVGKLDGAEGGFVCGDRLPRLFLAFRSHGGPIYWLRLETFAYMSQKTKQFSKRSPQASG
jgi:hypothetical protein